MGTDKQLAVATHAHTQFPLREKTDQPTLRASLLAQRTNQRACPPKHGRSISGVLANAVEKAPPFGRGKPRLTDCRDWTLIFHCLAGALPQECGGGRRPHALSMPRARPFRLPSIGRPASFSYGPVAIPVRHQVLAITRRRKRSTRRREAIRKSQSPLLTRNCASGARTSITATL